MEQHITEFHSESKLDPKEEEDRKELVSKRPCRSDKQPSEPKQKKQKLSATKPNSGVGKSHKKISLVILQGVGKS